MFVLGFRDDEFINLKEIGSI